MTFWMCSIDLKPTSAEAHFNRGDTSEELGRYQAENPLIAWSKFVRPGLSRASGRLPRKPNASPTRCWITFALPASSISRCRMRASFTHAGTSSIPASPAFAAATEKQPQPRDSKTYRHNLNPRMPADLNQNAEKQDRFSSGLPTKSIITNDNNEGHHGWHHRCSGIGG